MNFKNFLSKVKAFFVALGLKILAGLKMIGPACKSAAKKLWAKIKSAPKKKLITYTLVPVALFVLCLVVVLCSDGGSADDQLLNNGSSTGGVIEENVVTYGPKFVVYGDSYSVDGYLFEENEKDVVIPSVYEKSSVVRIGTRAFENVDHLTSITLPDSIVEIGEYAFSGCDSLTKIVIPASVKTISARAFYNCKNLTSIEFKSAENEKASLSIGDYAFAGCFSPASATATYDLVIPENVVSIGEGAFEACAAIKSVSLPSTLENLSTGAFYKCAELVTVTFAINCVLETIAPSAFKDCVKLAKISIPEGIAKIGYEAFLGCSALAEVHLPESLKSIGSYAFYGCTSLSSVYVARSGFISDVTLVDAYSNPFKYGASEHIEA